MRRDSGLQRSFYPIVEQALKISVTRNPGLLATSLAPIIGETVRKAVANAFRGLVENLNVMLERELLLESMKWRFEAMRTGKSVRRDRAGSQPALQSPAGVPHPSRDWLAC